MTMRRYASILTDDRGASAVEFALIAPVFLSMLFGMLYASMLGFATTSLHSAVESAARCRSMGIMCTNATTTQLYAKGQFMNVTGGTPVFASTTEACGNKVAGSVDFTFNWLIARTKVPLSATSCFPA